MVFLAAGMGGGTGTGAGPVVAEVAKELGRTNGDPLDAWGLNSRLTYFFRDPLQNQLRAGYEYLSGDRNGTKTNEGWDPMWGRWPQWSEMYAYTIAMETNGRPAYWTNLHRLQAGWTFVPCKPLEVCLDYHLLFADTNHLEGTPNFSEEGSIRGQLFTLLLNYKFNPHVSGHVLGEFFWPGNYYSDIRQDPECYLRYELTFTW